MADPVWLGYTGAITGIIGAVTGIAGSILGYIAYRRSEQLKSLDLRLELRKSSTTLILEANELLMHLEYAKKSKLAVAAATGMYKSGATEKWLGECGTDVEKIKQLLDALPNPDDQYLELTPNGLETKLVEVHALKETVYRFQKKYDESITKDDKDREKIAAAKVGGRYR